MIDTIEETISLKGGRDLSLLRPRDSEALLSEEAFEHEEFLPYWAELWPSAVALARAIAPRALRGARTLELGCGLGLPAIAAAIAGGRVLATDWSPESIEFTRENARRNGVELETLVCSWADPGPLVARAPWGLVLASDLLYEKRNAPQLLDLLPRLVDDKSAVLIADPGRRPAEAFFDEARRDWQIEEIPGGGERVTIRRLTRRRASGSRPGSS